MVNTSLIILSLSKDMWKICLVIKTMMAVKPWSNVSGYLLINCSLFMCSMQPVGLGKIAKLINAGKIDSSELITMKTLKVVVAYGVTIALYCLSI